MHKVDDLREHLFAALRSLRDDKMEIARAKAIAEIAQTIINSAKVEVDYINAAGGTGSGFLPMKEAGDTRADAALRLVKK